MAAALCSFGSKGSDKGVRVTEGAIALTRTRGASSAARASVMWVRKKLTEMPDPAKVKADGTGLVYATFIGGSQNDRGLGMSLDTDDTVVIVGETLGL